MNERVRNAYQFDPNLKLAPKLAQEVVLPCRSRTGPLIVICTGVLMAILLVQFAVRNYQNQKVSPVDLQKIRALESEVRSIDAMIDAGNAATRSLDEQIYRARSKVQRRWDLYKDRTYKPSAIWATDGVIAERWDTCQ